MSDTTEMIPTPAWPSIDEACALSEEVLTWLDCASGGVVAGTVVAWAEPCFGLRGTA